MAFGTLENRSDGGLHWPRCVLRLRIIHRIGNIIQRRRSSTCYASSVFRVGKLGAPSCGPELRGYVFFVDYWEKPWSKGHSCDVKVTVPTEEVGR